MAETPNAEPHMPESNLLEPAADSEVLEVSRRLLDKNRDAYRELAK